MEDILGFLAFVVIAAISIISRIVSAKKKESIFTGGVLPQKKPVAKKRQTPTTTPKPAQKTVNQNLQQSPDATPVQKPFMGTQHEMTKKKSLIEEEPEFSVEAKPESLFEVPSLPVETPVSSYRSLADSLKANRKFAIICHEVLGKPKALED